MRSQARKKRQSEKLSPNSNNFLQTSISQEQKTITSSIQRSAQASGSSSLQRSTGFNFADISISSSQMPVYGKSAQSNQHSFLGKIIPREEMPEKSAQMKHLKDSRKSFFSASERREESKQQSNKTLNPLVQAKLANTVTRENNTQVRARSVPEVLQKVNQGRIHQVNQEQQVQRHQEDKDDMQMKEESSQIQRHAGHHHDEDGMQMKKASSGGSFTANGAIENKIKSSRGQGKSLDGETRSFMEPRFGTSFAHVKVHTGSDAVQMNRDLHSHAFTQGNDIYFNQGKYNPDSSSGKQLLAHELTHTIQQTGGVSLQKHPAGEEKTELQQKPESGAHTQGCTCNTCTGASIQRQVNGNGNASNFLGQNLIQSISTASSEKLQRQTSHEKGCSCPLCTGDVQTKLTVGAPGDKYEQEADRMADKVMAMPDSQVSGGNSLQRHGGHEHEEEMAQTKSLYHSVSPLVQRHRTVQRQALVNQVSTTSGGVIQRHSSHEHYLLGNVSPEDLANIPFIREARQKVGKQGKLGGDDDDEQSELSELMPSPPKNDYEKQYKQVKHTIQQHLTLLENFIKDPEFLESKISRKGKDPGQVYKSQKDDTWEVPYIELPVRSDNDENESDTTVVLYGELNTLPDFFGNPEAIAATPKNAVLSILQGVRQRVYKNLLAWYNDEILDQDEKKWEDKREKKSIQKNKRKDFKNAKGPKDVNPNKVVGGLSENEANETVSKHLKDEDQSESYFAALERNACHFAPYSWDAWQRYHEKALELANKASYLDPDINPDIIKTGENPFEPPEEIPSDENDPFELEKLKKEDELKKTYKDKSAALKNKALLQNAFGDHYLQDSYAAGHLVDKTLIMQYLVKWLSKNQDSLEDQYGLTKEEKNEFYGSEQGWKMIKMVTMDENNEIRNLKSDPQKLHDDLVKGKFHQEEYSKEDNPFEKDEEMTNMSPMERAARSLGLEPTDEIIFLMWWRDQASRDEKHKKDLKLNEILKLLKTTNSGNYNSFDPNGNNATQALSALVGKLIKLGFVKKKVENDQIGNAKYSIKEAIIRQKRGKALLKGKKRPGYESKVQGSNFREQASEFNIAAYHKFMSRAFVQKITNYFHDIYCKEGLDVITGDGKQPFKIYGDKNMLNAGAQKGVQHSGETGRLSRDSIIKTMQGISLDNKEKTSAIRNRFPNRVVIDKKEKSLANWNVEDLATDENFKKALTGFKGDDAIATAMKRIKSGHSLSGGKAIDLAKLANTSFKPVHGNEEF